jgi:HEAT repeat protein
MLRLHCVVLSALLVVGCNNGPREARIAARPDGAAKDAQPSAAGPVAPEASAAATAETKQEAASDDGAIVALRPAVIDNDVPQFRQPTEQEVAATALGRIGRAAVPSLITALRHRDPQVREQAAAVLARIGPQAYEAVPDLTAALDDQDSDVRKTAARALGQIGPAAADAVPALMRALVQPDATPVPRTAPRTPTIRNTPNIRTPTPQKNK